MQNRPQVYSHLEQSKLRVVHLSGLVDRLAEAWEATNTRPEFANRILELPGQITKIVSLIAVAETYDEIALARIALLDFDEIVMEIVKLEAIQNDLPDTRSRLTYIREKSLGLCQTLDKSLDEKLGRTPKL